MSLLTEFDKIPITVETVQKFTKDKPYKFDCTEIYFDNYIGVHSSIYLDTVGVGEGSIYRRISIILYTDKISIQTYNETNEYKLDDICDVLLIMDELYDRLHIIPSYRILEEITHHHSETIAKEVNKSIIDRMMKLDKKHE